MKPTTTHAIWQKIVITSLVFFLFFANLTVDAQTNKGKEFWVAEMPNLSTLTTTYTNVQFVISVSNTSVNPATVRISKPNGVGGFDIVRFKTIASGSLDTFSFPTANDAITVAQPGVGATMVATTGSYYVNVYKVESDVPVVANSFTPWVNVQSNDADLHLPTHALGKKYRVGSYVHTNPAAAQHSQIGVIATKPGITNVKIYNKSNVLLDNVNLQQGQYFQRLNGNLVANDVTGYYVEGDQAIAVYSGNQISAVGVSAQASYHLVEQILLLETLAKTYIAAPPWQRPFNFTTNWYIR